MEVHRNFWLARRKILASRAALRAWNPRAAVYTVWNPDQLCWAAHVGAEPEATDLVSVWNLRTAGRQTLWCGTWKPLGSRVYGVEPFAVGTGPVRPFNSAAACGFGQPRCQRSCTDVCCCAVATVPLTCTVSRRLILAPLRARGPASTLQYHPSPVDCTPARGCFAALTRL